jgi:hypothetical protein
VAEDAHDPAILGNGQQRLANPGTVQEDVDQ